MSIQLTLSLLGIGVFFYTSEGLISCIEIDPFLYRKNPNPQSLELGTLCSAALGYAQPVLRKSPFMLTWVTLMIVWLMLAHPEVPW